MPWVTLSSEQELMKPTFVLLVATNHITRQHLYIMSVANNVSIPISKIIVWALNLCTQTKLKTKLNYIFIFG